MNEGNEFDKPKREPAPVQRRDVHLVPTDHDQGFQPVRTSKRHTWKPYPTSRCEYFYESLGIAGELAGYSVTSDGKPVVRPGMSTFSGL